MICIKKWLFLSIFVIITAMAPTIYADNDVAYQLAEKYQGFTSAKDHSALSNLFRRELGVSADPRNTSWCALFMNSILVETGHKPTNNVYMARSFLNWGHGTNSPKVGDIVVFRDLTGQGRDWAGHVGFFMGYDENGYVLTLGGNENDMVRIKSYPAFMVLSFRSVN